MGKPLSLRLRFRFFRHNKVMMEEIECRQWVFYYFIFCLIQLVSFLEQSDRRLCVADSFEYAFRRRPFNDRESLDLPEMISKVKSLFCNVAGASQNPAAPSSKHSIFCYVSKHWYSLFSLTLKKAIEIYEKHYSAKCTNFLAFSSTFSSN